MLLDALRTFGAGGGWGTHTYSEAAELQVKSRELHPKLESAKLPHWLSEYWKTGGNQMSFQQRSGNIVLEEQIKLHTCSCEPGTSDLLRVHIFLFSLAVRSPAFMG